MTATAAKIRQNPASLRLLPPRELHYSAPALSADQEAVVSLGQGSGPVLVPGGPGTGKSTVLVESAVRRVSRDGLDPENILILAPGRHAAAALRDTFTGRLARSLSTTPARTWASYAFDVIRRAKAEGILPLPRQPKLLSGPEQDLIIKELLEGHVQPGFELPWPEDLSAALPTRGFRHEIRQLFDRIIESGRTAEDLVALGYECGRPDWIAAAELYREYRDVLDLRMPEAFDPAGIITTARQIFQDSPAFLAAERDRLKLILVDDAQEANPAVFELLADIGENKDIVVTYSPDTVVQGFRGARPDLVADLPSLVGGPLESVLVRPLEITHRHTVHVAEAWKRVASRISQRSGGQMARRLDQPPTDRGVAGKAGAGGVEGHVLPSAVHELRYVAQRILEAQLRDGRDFSQIAVIVRNGGQISQLQRYLVSQGIPVRVPVADSAVRDEVAVRPLLEAYAVALDPAKLTPEAAVSLLTSRIGGASAIELRRLRQSLRREELQGGGGRASDALLVEALLQPGSLATLGIEGSAARRLARMLAAGTAAVEEPGANAESVLWALWHATGLASRWSEAALEGGNAGARADRDLDAMMALFHTAERFVDQLPGSGPEQFLEYLLNQELPMDTLAARAQLEECVELLTPASAAGREWPVVIVAGLQEGVWPNTRLRGELLGSTLYADAVEHGVEYALGRGPLSRLRDIRYDELRSFSTAVSRAREVLICTAVSSEDEQPSAFLDHVAPLPSGEFQRDYTPVDRPMTLRALVAELRQHAQAGEPGAGEPQLVQEAARVLARLAAAEPPTPGAHPDSWWGLAPLSSTEAIVPAGGTVSVSPSKVEAVHKSPLDWFVQAAGGEPTTDFARSLGTLVHGIAQELPEASGAEYVAELVRRWPTLGMKDNWEGKLDFQRAELMVRKLAQYVVVMRSEGRSLVAVEHDFEVRLADVVPPGEAPDGSGSIGRQAILRGQVDRLEIDSEGRLVIVDLKTGKRQPGKAEVARHPQLGAYQAAVLKGAFGDRDGLGADGPPTPGGAVLAQLGTKTKTPVIQQQDALDSKDNWAEPMVNEAAELMAGATFEARHDPGKSGHGGNGCRLPDVCPLCARGKQVTE
ncbi:ATP-dependent helicase [Paenarthrobacter sp. NPDC058040]|uniref:ATP-dependent helicase n=1 Tax=unclassified Paenarthrobacter TaxID=2634190 RepID=UPI0036DD2125